MIFVSKEAKLVLERPELFSRREAALFVLICLLIALGSVGLQYRAYSQLKRFDDALIDAEVLTQYVKEGERGRYSVLKLRGEGGMLFYTSGPELLRPLVGYRLQLRIPTERLDFYGFMNGFYAPSTILYLYPVRNARMTLAEKIASLHRDHREGEIFAALLTASPLAKETRQALSALGVSHLMAISGFHLGLLSLLLFAGIDPLLKMVQSRRFPYVNRRLPSFLLVAAVLFGYLWFLDYVPSLVRAFAMLCIGYLLYDRGIRIVSMQTLFVTVLLLAALWPRLALSLGFWLSVAGVFYILLFLKHFSGWSKTGQFFGVHLWVYAMMLPLSLFWFETFGPMHPLSILWSMLFIAFYPLTLALHLVGMEQLLAGPVALLLDTARSGFATVPLWGVLLHTACALAAVAWRWALWPLVGTTLAVFVGAVYQIT